jgi:hypothetical protein
MDAVQEHVGRNEDSIRRRGEDGHVVADADDYGGVPWLPTPKPFHKLEFVAAHGMRDPAESESTARPKNTEAGGVNSGFRVRRSQYGSCRPIAGASRVGYA